MIHLVLVSHSIRRQAKFTYHSAMLRDALAELHGGDQVEVVRKV